MGKHHCLTSKQRIKLLLKADKRAYLIDYRKNAMNKDCKSIGLNIFTQVAVENIVK
jgi:hypothetical protein